jgi:hypothetical protein
MNHTCNARRYVWLPNGDELSRLRRAFLAWSEETHIWLRLLCKEIQAVTWFTIQQSPATHITVESVGQVLGADLSFEPLWHHSINLPDCLGINNLSYLFSELLRHISFVR